MDKIKEFYNLADKYCHFISAKEMTISDIATLMELLMKLYISAVNLPETEPETINSVVSDETDEILITFAEQIPQLYWEIFDPFNQEDAVCANLADDLSDIATDLYDGMREFEAGRTGNAVFEWKFGLNNHWGKHATDALRALHAIRIR
ncbi:MAG: DUF5063 domain-containing protein [Saccharofermentanales bacterium]|jgi:hypothetical protein